MGSPTRRDAALIVLPLLLLLVGCAITLAGLDDVGFKRQSECRTAVVAREMLQSGDVLTPTVNGQPRLEKPPLFYWAIALTAHFTGTVDEFTARLPAWISNVLLATLLCGFAAHRARWQGDKTPLQTGLLSALLLLCLPGFWQRGMLADAESLLALACFAVTAALYWNLRETSLWRLLAAYLLSALAFMVKGPIFLLFMWPAYLWIGRGQHRRQAVWHLLGLLIFFPLALSWYGAVAWKNAEAFGVFFNEVAMRFDSEKATHQEPFYFYLLQIPLSCALFMPWLPFALHLAWRRLEENRAEKFLLLNALLAVSVLSFLKSKQAHYVLPLYPFLALWLADWATRQPGKAGQRLNAVLLLIVTLLVLGAGGLLWIFGTPWLAAGCIVLGLCGGWLWSIRRNRGYNTCFFVWLCAVVVATYVLNWQILQPLRAFSLNQANYFQALRELSANGGLKKNDPNEPCFIFGYGKPVAPEITEDASYAVTRVHKPFANLVVPQNFNAAHKEWLWKRDENRGAMPGFPRFDAGRTPWQMDMNASVPFPIPVRCGRSDLYRNGDISVLRLALSTDCSPSEWQETLAQALRRWQAELLPWKLLWLQGAALDSTGANALRPRLLRELTTRMATFSGAALVLDESGLLGRNSLPKGILVLNKDLLNGGILHSEGDALRLDKPGASTSYWRRNISPDGPRYRFAP